MAASDLIIAFDPGRNIGCARVSGAGELLDQQVLNLEQLAQQELPLGATILVGDGTGSRQLLKLLSERGLQPVTVDERDTSLQARQLYWQHNPPAGLLRLVPPGLRPQPTGLDGYAAWALALRWLAQAD